MVVAEAFKEQALKSGIQRENRREAKAYKA